MQDPMIHQKQQDSLYRHYKVKVPIQNKEIRERIRKTFIQKYGTQHKLARFHQINGVFCSKTQSEICDYFNFVINGWVDKYCVDGIKDNLIIEYNGGGHDLSVQLGKISQEDFFKKEKERIDFLLSCGYHILIIENPNDIILNLSHYKILNKLLNELQIKNKIICKVVSSTTIENVSEQSKD